MQQASGCEPDDQAQDEFADQITGRVWERRVPSAHQLNRDDMRARTDHGDAAKVSPSADTKVEPKAQISTERPAGGSEFFRTAARLGLQASEALEYAHSMGVVHRDVKPSNLLVDAHSHLWITDFGLAMVESKPHLTMTGDVLGTLRYMSPEQALAKRVIIDHRTDVYSLGATLYELVTLQPAYTGHDRQELFRQIAFEEPKSPRRLNKRVPVDLETIILKAMAKNPAERYATAQAMADDLRCFLADKPILARRPSFPQLAAQWCRRHQPLVASALVSAALLLILVAIGSTILAARLQGVAQREQQVAQQERQAKNEIAEQNRTNQRLLASSYLDKGQVLCEQGKIGDGMLWLAHALEIAPQDARELRQAIRSNLAAWYNQLNVHEMILDHGQEVTALAFSPQADKLASGCVDGTVRIWDRATGQIVGKPMIHDGTKAKIEKIAFSPDGEQIAVGPAGHVQFWNIATCEPVGTAISPSAKTISYSCDGTQLATVTDHAVFVWNVATSGLIRKYEVPDPLILDGRFTEQGLRIVSYTNKDSSDGKARVWDATTMEPLGPVTEERVSRWVAVLSADGTRIAAIPRVPRYSLAVWSAKTGKKLGPPKPVNGTMLDLAFSSDGSRAVTGGMDCTARVHDAEGGLLGEPMQHAGWVTAVACSEDGLNVVSGSKDGTVRVWRGANPRRWSAQWEVINNLCFSPDGSKIAGARSIVDVTSGQSIRLRSEGRIGQFSRDGKFVATGGVRCPVEIWDAETGQRIGHQLGQGAVPMDFSPDGSQLLTSSLDHVVQLWDLATGNQTIEPIVHQDPVRGVAFSPDGEHFLTGGFDFMVHVWDARTGRRLADPIPQGSEVKALAYSSDGDRFIVGLANGTARLWNARTFEPIGEPLLHHGGVWAVGFHPDSVLAATGSLDRTARLWDSATGKPIGPPFLSASTRNAFFPDGQFFAYRDASGTSHFCELPRQLVSARDDQHIKLWTEVVTGLELDLDQGGVTRVLDAATWLEKRSQLDDLGGEPLISVADSPDSDRLRRLLSSHLPATEDLLAGRWEDALRTSESTLKQSPATYRDHLLRARAHAALKNHEQAMREFGRALELQPNERLGWIQRGSYYLEIGRVAEAEADFKRVLKLPGETSQSCVMSDWWIAGPYPNELDKEEAVEANASVLEFSQDTGGADSPDLILSPWRPGFTECDGHLTISRRIPDKVMAAYAMAFIYSATDQDANLISGTGGSAKVWLNGEVLMDSSSQSLGYKDSGVFVRLRAGWNTLMAKVVDPQSRYELFAQIEAAPWLEIAQRGRKRAEQGDWDEAARGFDQAIQLSGNRPTVRRAIVSWCEQMATDQWKAGNYEVCERLLRRAIATTESLAQTDPRNFISQFDNQYHMLAMTLYRMGRWEEAAQAERQRLAGWELQVRHGPTWAWYHFHLAERQAALGNFLQQIGRKSEADEHFANALASADRGLKPYSTSWSGHRISGNIHAFAGRSEQALSSYQRSLQLLPSNARTHQSLAVFRLTTSDPNFRDPELALEHATEAITINPSKLDFVSTYGQACYRTGDYVAAVEALQRSLTQTFTDSVNELLFLAMAQWQVGQQQEAQQSYEQAAMQMDGRSYNAPSLLDLRAEAAALLRVAEQAKPADASSEDLQ